MNTVLLGNVVDQFHDQHGLSHARAAEQADLAALGVGGDEVHDLDACFQNLGGGFLLVISGRLAVDGPALLSLRRGKIVHRVSQQIEDAAQALIAHGHRDGAARIHGFRAAHKAVGAGHGDAAHNVVADVLRHLQRDGVGPVLHRDGIQQARQMPVGEFDVQHRPDDLGDCADVLIAHWLVSFE